MRQPLVGLVESSVLVDNRKLFDDVIMETRLVNHSPNTNQHDTMKRPCLPVEHDKQDAATGRETQKSLLGEAICLQFAILERPDLILVLLCVSIKCGKVKI